MNCKVNECHGVEGIRAVCGRVAVFDEGIVPGGQFAIVARQIFAGAEYEEAAWSGRYWLGVVGQIRSAERKKEFVGNDVVAGQRCDGVCRRLIFRASVHAEAEDTRVPV